MAFTQVCDDHSTLFDLVYTGVTLLLLLILLIHRLANHRITQKNNKTIDKSINMAQTSSQLVRIDTAPCVQIDNKMISFLLDSGSDANIISYDSFSKMGFKYKFLDNSTVYNIKSSQGYQQDVVLGTFSTKLSSY